MVELGFHKSVSFLVCFASFIIFPAGSLLRLRRWRTVVKGAKITTNLAIGMSVCILVYILY